VRGAAVHRPPVHQPARLRPRPDARPPRPADPEATAADIADLGEQHGYHVLRVTGKGTKVVLVPLPPAVGRAIDQAAAGRVTGPILRNGCGRRMHRHTATRRLQHLAASASFAMPHLHPHMLRHTYVTTMLDAGVDLCDVQIAARHADPGTTMRYDRVRKNLDRHANYIVAAYTWPPAHDPRKLRGRVDNRASANVSDRRSPTYGAWWLAAASISRCSAPVTCCRAEPAGQGALEPGGVDGEGAGRGPAVVGVLAAPDAVLHLGVRALPGLQLGQLPGRGVAGEGLEPPPVHR